jgi:Bacterial TSP3 repeat
MRVGVIAVLVCLTLACFSGAIAQDQTIITNGLTQIVEELCKDDWNLFYFPDGLGWQVYPIDYWQPKWINFSEYSLATVKSNATFSANPCLRGQSQYGVQPLHITVTLDLLSGDLVLRPGCASEELARIPAPKSYEAGQWPADCRVVDRLWQQWQSIQSDPDWQEWYGKDAKPFLTFHFQLADLIADKPVFDENLAAEEAAWEESAKSSGPMLMDSVEGGDTFSMLMQGDPCDTNEFQILAIESDEQGWVTVGWCGASNVVYQLQASAAVADTTIWEPQQLLIGEGFLTWQDTNAPSFWPARFYRCRALPGNEDADGDGLSNIAEFNLGTGIDNPDTDGDGIPDGDEVNVHGTNPLNPDSDNDFWMDGAEVSQGYSPTNSASFPLFSFTINDGADVVTNTQLQLGFPGLVADSVILSESITMTNSVTNSFVSPLTYTLVNTNDGLHVIYVQLLKSPSTRSPIFGRTIELDTHTPMISISSPSNAVTVAQRRVNLQGFAADASTTNALVADASRALQVTVNSDFVNDRDTNGNWWAGPLDLVAGTNTFLGAATDRAGWTVSNTVTVIFDPTLATNVPLFTIDVTNTITVASNATTIAASGWINDDNATVQIDVLDAADSTITNASISAAVHGTNWWGEIPVVPGSNIVVVSAQNSGSLPATNAFTVIQDMNVFLEITSPAANTAANSNGVMVVGLASANFNGTITINGQAALTSSGAGGITFSNMVTINNVDANIIEVRATGSDGSSATARQIIYGYEVVAFRHTWPYKWQHLRSDCWLSMHYPNDHRDHGDGDELTTWTAPDEDVVWTAYDNTYGSSENLISHADYYDTWSWDPRYLPTPDTGEVRLYKYRDAKHVEAGLFSVPDFRDCWDNHDCGEEEISGCCIDSTEEILEVQSPAHEVTFIKHWPTDEEQTVILHFQDFYYYLYDIDVTKIRLWGQPGFAYEVVDYGWGPWTNVGFVVKIKTNTRYTFRNDSFSWPVEEWDSQSQSPNAQSTLRYHDTWHAFYYDSFANTNAVHIKFVDRDGFTHNAEYTTTDVMVGERIELTAVPDLSIAAPVTPVRWEISGPSVKDYTQTLQAAEVATNTAADLQGKTNVVFHWIAGGQNVLVEYRYLYEGQEYSSHARFNVLRPSAALSAAWTSENPPVAVRTNSNDGQVYMRLGSFSSPGISFSGSVGRPQIGGGSIAVVQLVNIFRSWEKVEMFGPTVFTFTSSGHYVLDCLPTNGTPQYAGIVTLIDTEAASTPIDPRTVDSPGNPVTSDTFWTNANDQFDDYLVFQSDRPGSIWTTLRKLHWSWSGFATNGPTGWTMISQSNSKTNSVDSTQLPVWTNAVIYIPVQ